MVKDLPITAEEIIVEEKTEQQIIQELREQVRILRVEKEEWEKRYNDKDDLVVEYFQTLKNDNKETKLVAVLEKRKQIEDLKKENTELENNKNNEIKVLKEELTRKDQELAQRNSQASAYSVLRNKIDNFKRNYSNAGDWWWYGLFQGFFTFPDAIIRHDYTFVLPRDWNRETLERLCRDMRASAEAIGLLNSL